MSKILFLDIDGVILNGNNLHKHFKERGNNWLPEEKLVLLHEVLDRTGAKLVISSTWRISTRHAQTLINRLGPRMHLDWSTPYAIDYEGQIMPASTRGIEIKTWLDRNPTEIYAIIDDDSDMLDEQIPFFVHTDFHTGIERKHVEKLVKILGET